MNPNNTSPSAVALANWSPAPAATLAPPAHIFAGYDVPAHLAPDALCGDILRTVAAYGTAARLWTPANPDPLAALDAADDPVARFDAWFRALPADVLDACEASAYIACDRLREGVVGGGAVNYRGPMVEWLRTRTEIGTVADALRSVGRGVALAEYLARLDDGASYEFVDCESLHFAAREIAADAFLRAVAWQEPDALVGVIVGEALTSTVR